MYKMSTRSKVIRVVLLPIYLILWLVGGTIMLLHILFEFVFNKMDRLMDKFNSWINKVAPLG